MEGVCRVVCNSEVDTMISHLTGFMLLGALLLISTVRLLAAQDSDGLPEIVATRRVELEHSMGGDIFKPRGMFTIQMDEEGNVAVVNADKFGITEDILEDFQTLLSSEGLYKLRMRSSGEKNAPYVQTSIPACSLQRSGFKEDLALFVSADQSLTIRGTSYNSPIIGLARNCDAKALKAPSMFLSRIKIGENQKVQDIPLQATSSKPYYLSHVKVATETYTDKDGKTRVRTPAHEAQEFPWYRKYWYLIVAAALYMMLSPEAPAQGAAKKKRE